MVRDWRSALKADPTEWLLELCNPSVRFFALRDLLDCDERAQEVVETKKLILSDEKVLRIFRKQDPAGFWGSPESPYLPKYKSTYWQIMILGQLGLDRSDERVRRACEFIFQFQHEEGGFTQIGEEGAKNEYQLFTERLLRKGKTPPPLDAWVKNKIREDELTCLTGNISAALIRLGYGDDARVGKAIGWLVDVQNEDGGWLCPYWGAHIRDKHGCFMGTITPLDAFSQLPPEKKTPEISEAIERGVEFLLMHRLFKADHHGFKVIDERWLKLGFPCFGYDLLRGLSVVTRLGYAEDDRIDDALEVLLGKQNENGKWILESTPSGRMQVDLERKGEPSKWVTLNALRVIKQVHQSRNP